MTPASAVTVRRGQVWECLAKYDRGRTFKVLRVEYDAGKGSDAAVCEILTNSDYTQDLIDNPRTMPSLRPSDRRGHQTRIRIDRFRPSSSGYRLVSDAPVETIDPRFSTEALAWLSGYHGSVDTTALLLAFDAGVAEVGRLLTGVHERLGGGIDISTFANGTVEIRWRRLYPTSGETGGELSDERFTSAPGLVAALHNVLTAEDEADATDAHETRSAAEAAR